MSSKEICTSNANFFRSMCVSVRVCALLCNPIKYSWMCLSDMCDWLKFILCNVRAHLCRLKYWSNRWRDHRSINTHWLINQCPTENASCMIKNYENNRRLMNEVYFAVNFDKAFAFAQSANFVYYLAFFCTNFQIRQCGNHLSSVCCFFFNR